MDPTTVFCPNGHCHARGQAGMGNIGIHSRKEQRFICHECQKTFSATTGTALGSAIHVMLVKPFRVTVDQNASPSNGGQQQMMVIRDVCPQCKSAKYKKNGHTHNGKQNHHCHDCGRQFVQCFEQYLISEDKRALIKRLLVERISLRGICRAVGVTLKWLLGFLVQCFEALPDHLHVQPVSCQHDVLIQRLAVEADELASFVQKKANKQWIWIAMDATTRQIIAFHVGDRSHTSAEQLWAKIPQAYRHHATFYTDQYVVYEKVIPAAQHKAISKLARKTNHIERFNNTLRQRVSRLVRDALSFSKKLAHHIGAIKLFICHYNLTRAAV